jgi:hypothetical protein
MPATTPTAAMPIVIVITMPIATAMLPSAIRLATAMIPTAIWPTAAILPATALALPAAALIVPVGFRRLRCCQPKAQRGGSEQ